MKKNTIWPQLRLSWWITIGVATIVMITTLLLLIVVDQFARNYARHEAEMRLKQLAWQMRDAFDHTMKQRIDDIKDLSQRGLVRNYADPAALRIALTLAKNEFSDYAWIGVTDPSGKVVAGTQSMLEGRSVAQRPWFIGGKKDLYVGSYQPPAIKQTLPFALQPLGLIDISTPIFDPKGNYRGVLGAHLSWDWAREIAHDLLNPANQRYNVDVLVVRDDGLVLLGPQDLEAKKIKTDSLDLARKGGSGSVLEQWGDSDGKRYITGYVRTGAWTGETGLNWSILVRQSEHVALADILVLEKQMVIVAIMEALLLAVCAGLLSYKFVAPMNALSQAFESRSTIEDDYVAKGWSYYEFNRLSTAVGAIPKHQFGADSEVFEQRVGERVHQLRELIADLPEMHPGMPAPEHYRNRDLFQ